MAESASEDLTASGADSGGASVAWGLETSIGGVSTETGLSQSGNQGIEPAVIGRRALVPVMELDGSGERSLDSTEADALKILLQASAAAESLQQRFSELNQRRAALVAEQQQLEHERRAFEQRAHDFAAEVAQSRAEQRELTADLERRLARVGQQEELLTRQSAELRNAQRLLAEERVVLKQSVRAELDDERMKLSQERASLDAAQVRLREQGERDRQEHSDRLAAIQEELRQERQRLADLARETIAAETSQLGEKRLELERAYEQQVQELQVQVDDLQRQREQFGEQVELEQQRLREEVEKKRQALLSEQNNLQRRYRFQFEHLTRAKEDLEEELRAFRREQQLFRSERLRFMEQHRLRFRQMERVRSLLSSSEESLGRELRILDRTRNATMADLLQKQRRSEEEREAVVRDIESRQRSLRQQEVSLAELASRLEERSQRLTRMRAELDQTQSEILEQRLVIEEARDALVRDAVSPEIARARLEQARHDVQSYFERLRLQVFAERDKVDTALAELAERQAEFRQDRAELEQYFASREEELGTRSDDGVLHQQLQMNTELRDQLATLQQRWQGERLEAERTIRELLDQLTQREISQLSSAPSPPGATPGTRGAA
ncbi:MAG: hypothetical protein RLZZ232_2179 [Planctomycetota bacterium]|jgi:chromosome segregation ATPase